jgi:hypothetical protein
VIFENHARAERKILDGGLEICLAELTKTADDIKELTGARLYSVAAQVEIDFAVHIKDIEKEHAEKVAEMRARMDQMRHESVLNLQRIKAAHSDVMQDVAERPRRELSETAVECRDLQAQVEMLKGRRDT